METKRKRCIICASFSKGKLCKKCNKSYLYDKKLGGARLRKILKSARLRKKFDNRCEKKLYTILRQLFGKTFRDFRAEWAPSPKGVALEYDLVVPEKKILIEVDGPYHWNRDLYKSDEAFEYRKLCDKIKEEHAANNGWKFFRIDLETMQITRANVKKLVGIQPKARMLKKIRRV